MTRKILSSVPPSAEEPLRSGDTAVVAATRAVVLTAQLRELLGPHFHALADDERQALAPVPNAFAEVGPPMIQALGEQTGLLAYLEDFDLAQVIGDVARAEALRVLENQLEPVLRAVHDSLRMYEARAYTALLPVYHAGKVRAAHDAGIQAVVAPLQKVYAARRPGKTTKKD